jgi:radical SAM superfamily enzyme YgiQ (UPF0313 family)
MLVRGYYMIGVPGETPDQFRQGIERLCLLSIDEIRFAYFTPFPGTGVYQEYGRYCITEDLSMFTSAEPVLELPTFKVSEQLAAGKWALKRFYCGDEYGKRWREKVRRFPRFKESYEEFFQFLAKHDLHVN